MIWEFVFDSAKLFKKIFLELNKFKNFFYQNLLLFGKKKWASLIKYSVSD